MLIELCRLRAESIKGQLDGTIPSTTSGQSADASSLVDASSIDLSALGTMGPGMGQGGPQGQQNRPGRVGGDLLEDISPEALNDGSEQGPETQGE